VLKQWFRVLSADFKQKTPGEVGNVKDCFESVFYRGSEECGVGRD